MEIIAKTLAGLEIGPARTFAGLTVYPLLGPEGRATAGYRTLDEALAAGIKGLVEVSRSGQVSELSFENDGDRPVLLRVETAAGHGAGKPVGKLVEDLADQWSFLFAQLGVESR